MVAKIFAAVSTVAVSAETPKPTGRAELASAGTGVSYGGNWLLGGKCRCHYMANYGKQMKSAPVPEAGCSWVKEDGTATTPIPGLNKNLTRDKDDDTQAVLPVSDRTGDGSTGYWIPTKVYNYNTDNADAQLIRARQYQKCCDDNYAKSYLGVEEHGAVWKYSQKVFGGNSDGCDQ